jgi:prepilin peptidase CpaA
MNSALLAPTMILLGALITDVRTHKIPNKWILISIAIALFSSYYFYSFEGLKQGALASGLAIILTLPFVMIGALGAGDLKLLFVFGLATTYQTVFSVVMLSFLWGALLGVAWAIREKKFKKLISNTFKIISVKPHDKTELMKIPYTIAIFFAWMTYLLIGFKQGAY